MCIFQNNLIPLKTLINTIISNDYLGCDCINIDASPNMSDFIILKAFYIKIHSPNANIKEVIRLPPFYSQIKCNIDGTTHGTLGLSSRGGVFRDYQDSFLGCFASNNGIQNTLNAEIMSVILVIELAREKGQTHLWLEFDSQLVNLTFTRSKIFPWNLSNC